MIDFASASLNLAYLVEIEYRIDGSTKLARWCGPSSRVGRGLVAKHPTTGVMVQWEPRLSGASVDYDLGGLSSSVTRVSSVGFRVAAGGDDSADLRADAKNGSWVNGRATLWHYDIASKDAQHAGDGKVDRNPTGRDDGSFRIGARLAPYELDRRWPATRIPDAVPDEWDRTLSNSLLWTSNKLSPADFALNPDHRGKYRCHVFGTTTDGIWMEAVPFGTIVEKTFALVSGKLHGFVTQVAWIRDGTVYDQSDDVTWGGQTLRTAHQTHPDRGLMGTVVVFQYATGLSAVRPLWWGQDPSLGTGFRDKIMVKVSGYNAALEPTSHALWDPELGNWYNFGGTGSPDTAATPPFAHAPGAVRERYEHVLFDLMTDPDFLGLGSVFGTGAISAFTSTEPSSSVGFTRRTCAVPLEIVDEPPTFREVLAELMATLQADLCLRFDPVVEVMMIYPIWRGPRLGEPAVWKLTEEDLTRRQKPRPIAELDDPWGDYATRVAVTSPDFFIEPTFGDEGLIDPRDRFSTLFIDGVEESAGFAGIREKRIQFKYWLNQGPADSAGFKESARFAADHMTQRQRVIESTLGARGFRVQLGDLVSYDVDGYSDTVGQVRRVTLDLDRVTAKVRTLHINAFESLGTDGKGSGDEK